MRDPNTRRFHAQAIRLGEEKLHGSRAGTKGAYVPLAMVELGGGLIPPGKTLIQAFGVGFSGSKCSGNGAEMDIRMGSSGRVEMKPLKMFKRF
jgi:hypothetical protein